MRKFFVDKGVRPGGGTKKLFGDTVDMNDLPIMSVLVESDPATLTPVMSSLRNADGASNKVDADPQSVIGYGRIMGDIL